MGPHYALILRFGGMEILHVFEVRDPRTPTRLKVRVAQQIDTAMQKN